MHRQLPKGWGIRPAGWPRTTHKIYENKKLVARIEGAEDAQEFVFAIVRLREKRQREAYTKARRQQRRKN